MTENTSLAQRLNFFEIDDNTKDFLKTLKPFFEKNMNDVLESFYGHMKNWPDLAGMFKDQRHMDHAKQKQYEHWMQHIVSGELGRDYEQSVRAIGKAHHRLGLGSGLIKATI